MICFLTKSNIAFVVIDSVSSIPIHAFERRLIRIPQTGPIIGIAFCLIIIRAAKARAAANHFQNEYAVSNTLISVQFATVENIGLSERGAPADEIRTYHRASIAGRSLV